MSEDSNEILMLHDEVDRRVRFISKYLALGESHMVDFFVLDHWKNLIHPRCQEQLLECDEGDFYSVKTMLEKRDFSDDVWSSSDTDCVIGNLAEYFKEAMECVIENSQSCMDILELESQLTKTETSSVQNSTAPSEAARLVTTKEYMCCKKSHEVEKMSHVVNFICQRLEISHILDMGSGKGYLGTHLSLRYGLEVVGVDCSESNSTGAQLRSKKFLRYWNAHLKNKTELPLQQKEMKYQPLTALVSTDTDIGCVLPHATGDKQVLMLTGLHACGDLSSTALRTFVTKPEMNAMCIVGCCYHILTCTSDTKGGLRKAELGFPMSDYLLRRNFTLQRNSRLLGLKALERIQNTDSKITEEKSSRSLFFRAVLSVILEKELGMDKTSKDHRVGKAYSKSKDFIDYVRKSLRRLNVREEEIDTITDTTIVTYLNSMEKFRKSLLAFNMLREAFGPAVEALILLDKLLFLKEQNTSSNLINSHLVRLFDPVTSPRCYALIAMKNK